jgi:hypothetical protein
MTTINRSTRVGVITDQTGAHVRDTEIISGANKMESANHTRAVHSRAEQAAMATMVQRLTS